MELKTFFSRVLDTNGFYCVWAFKEDRTIQKFYNSIDQIIDVANNLNEENLMCTLGCPRLRPPNQEKYKT